MSCTVPAGRKRAVIVVFLVIANVYDAVALGESPVQLWKK